MTSSKHKILPLQPLNPHTQSLCPLTMIPFLTLLAALSCVPAVNAVGVTVETINGRSTCTVTALGNEQNDVPNIKSAFSQCGNGGTIVFPMDQNYWIAERINPLLKDARIDWK